MSVMGMLCQLPTGAGFPRHRWRKSTTQPPVERPSSETALAPIIEQPASLKS